MLSSEGVAKNVPEEVDISDRAEDAVVPELLSGGQLAWWCPWICE
jgi:hypothetical protein